MLNSGDNNYVEIVVLKDIKAYALVFYSFNLTDEYIEDFIRTIGID